jgi:hypothetical protein
MDGGTSLVSGTGPISVGARMAGKSDLTKEIELVPDAWPRFEHFIKQIAKSPPQHRVAKKTVAKKGKKKTKKQKPG